MIFELRTLLIVLKQVMEHMHDTIAISKKCCYACHLLGGILKDKKNRQFKLYGTHGRVVPWMPPAGLDHDVLVALKTHLVKKLEEVIKIKQKGSYEKRSSYQGSPASSDDESFGRQYTSATDKLRSKIIGV